MSAVRDGGVLDAGREDEPEVREFVRTEPLSTVKARLYAEAEEQRSRLASGQSESDEDEEATSSDEQATETESDSTAEDEAESSVQSEGGENSEVDPNDLSAQLRLAQEQFKSLSANTKRVTDELAQLKREREEAQQRQIQAQEQATYQQGVQEVQKINEYINSLPAEKQEAARRYYEARILAREAEAYQQYVLTQGQQVETARAELQLQQVRTALPEIVDQMIVEIGNNDESPIEVLKEAVKQEPLQRLLANYTEPRDLLLIGETLRAVGLVEKARKSSVRQENRQQAVAQGVHRGTRGAGNGNTSTFTERLKSVDSKDWDSFRQQVRRSGSLRKAIEQRG